MNFDENNGNPLGAGENAPDTHDMPETPAAQNAPGTPETPDAPAAADTPETPQTSEAPSPAPGAPSGQSPAPAPAGPSPDKPEKDGAKKLSAGSKAFIAAIAVVTCLVMVFCAVSVVRALHGQDQTPAVGPSASSSLPKAPNVTIDDLIMGESADNMPVTEAYNAVLPSVVGIKTYVLSSSSVYAEGSGMIISEDGYILTCNHVIQGCSTITIALSDSREFDAHVVAFDTQTDIAVLKIAAQGLVPVKFGSGNTAAIGSFVLAIGNPTGDKLAKSLAMGILSGKQRVSSLDSYTTLLQTDAALNPGNSGGPLFNLSGQVIGMVSAKIAGEKYEGIGFAIPSDEILPIVKELLENGYVSGRVRLGIAIIQYPPEIVMAQHLPGCVAVHDITEGTDAARSGLMVNDIITAIDGTAVTSSEQLIGIVRSHSPGDKVTLSIYRLQAGSSETLDVKITLYEDIGR